MKCVYVLKGGKWPCGNCLPCRLYKRLVWTSRIMLESKSHKVSSFLTLTYSDENLPPRHSLRPDDLRLWLYRFRNAAPRPFRYMAVGEYGDLYGRPHYHLVVFGLSPDECNALAPTWTGGFFQAKPLIPERAQYIAGYTVKKLTKADDSRLRGRYPEFMRSSRMGVGGIGASFVPTVSNILLTNKFVSEEIQMVGDVPSVLKHSGRLLPLGRYLRNKMRLNHGFNPNSLSFQVKRDKIASDKIYASLQLVREGSVSLEAFDASQGFIRGAEKVDQTILNLTTKFNLKKRKY